MVNDGQHSMKYLEGSLKYSMSVNHRMYSCCEISVGLNREKN